MHYRKITQLNNYVNYKRFHCIIIVGAGLSIKISDFGLAKRLNEDNYCAVEEGGVLPIRTMAPEIFLTGHFTTSSDIWYVCYY